MIKLIHYKSLVQEKVETECNNPTNNRMYKWLDNKDIKLKRLLKDMVREGLITIHYEEDRKKIRRIITNKLMVIDTI